MSWRRAVILIATLMALLPVVAQADRTVVLATGESCPIDALDSLDVRKAYLGVVVSVNGYHVRPLRLVGDDRLNQIFFQSIVAMSRKSYERRAVSLALKFGTPRPVEFSGLAKALDYIRDNECSVVYGWADVLQGLSDIKILRPLWQGE
jgi:hypothetical protein